jgi:hypothetical protein
MSEGVRNRQSQDYTLADLLSMWKKDIFLSLNCHAIATVQAFDAATQKVTATMNYKKVYIRPNGDGIYGEVEAPYPLLIDCPLIVLQGGSAALTMPISQGDKCLILFNDRDIDNWIHSGEILAPATERLHAFSDGIALVGLNPFSRPIADWDTTRAVLRNGNAMVGVGSEKLKLSNELYTLNGLLQELITEVKSLATQAAAITVLGVTSGASASGVPANAAAFTTIFGQLTTTATKIGALLE